MPGDGALYSKMGCCGVFAAAVASGLPVCAAWTAFQNKHRKHWHGWMRDNEMLPGLQKLGVVVTEITMPKPVILVRELSDLIKDSGKMYIVHISGHFLTIQYNLAIDQNTNGVVTMDMFQRRRSAVTKIYEIVANNPESYVDLPEESGDIKPISNQRRNPMSKIDRAKKIYTANATLSRKEMIALFAKELQMTDAGAGTYYATCKREAGTVQAVVDDVNQTIKADTATAPVTYSGSKAKVSTTRTDDPTKWLGFTPDENWSKELAGIVADLETWDIAHSKH